MSGSKLDSMDSGSFVEPKTGTVFRNLDGGKILLGVGLRTVNLLFLKTITIYSFGIYVDEWDMRKITEDKGSISINDVLESDIKSTIRIEIVYGRVSISQVRNAFEKVVGNGLKKYDDGSDIDDLLRSFISIFSDELKLTKGSVIEISREEGDLLVSKVDGKEVGRTQSKLLCSSVLDAYIGDDPFDKRAREEIQNKLKGFKCIGLGV